MAQIIPFRRGASHDDLTDYLLANVVLLQHEAIRLQNAGMRYSEVVVPARFGRVVRESRPTILGRKIIAADVDEIGVIVRP